MAKKTEYVVYTDLFKQADITVTYQYERTQVTLSVSECGFLIRTYRSAAKQAEEICSIRLFRDALKKASTARLLLYGNMSYTKLWARIGDETSLIYDMDKSNKPLIYGMCGEKLSQKTGKAWGKEQISYLVNKTKSSEGRLHAAMYAYLIAKSRIYESERFIYLWMAMNGLYSHIAEVANALCNGNKVSKEWMKLKLLAEVHDWPYRGIKEGEMKDKFRMAMENKCDKIHINEINQLVADIKLKSPNPHIAAFEEEIKKFVPDGELCVRAAMCILFPYLVRCKYFHSEKAIPMLCFEEEHPLPALRLLNAIMEDFLEEAIPKWMIDPDGTEYTQQINKALNDFTIKC